MNPRNLFAELERRNRCALALTENQISGNMAK
jgi:hypothetical protein